MIDLVRSMSDLLHRFDVKHFILEFYRWRLAVYIHRKLVRVVSHGCFVFIPEHTRTRLCSDKMRTV